MCVTPDKALRRVRRTRVKTEIAANTLVLFITKTGGKASECPRPIHTAEILRRPAPPPARAGGNEKLTVVIKQFERAGCFESEVVVQLKVNFH